MAFDGIVTRAAAAELSDALTDGKIDKIYEPEPDSVVINIRRGRDQMRLFASCQSQGASVRLISTSPENPKEPYPFCMLLRKHIQGSRIIRIEQKDSERIIEFTLERLNELGLMVQKKLIFEIMGKYSNIILVDVAQGWKILGSIKGVPSGINRVREILPGRIYEYPPVQEKIPFDEASVEDLENAGGSGKEILSTIGGISPAVADELAALTDGASRRALIDETLRTIDGLSFTARVYEDEAGIPREFHIIPLSGYEGCGR